MLLNEVDCQSDRIQGMGEGIPNIEVQLDRRLKKNRNNNWWTTLDFQLLTMYSVLNEGCCFQKWDKRIVKTFIVQTWKKAESEVIHIWFFEEFKRRVCYIFKNSCNFNIIQGNIESANSKIRTGSHLKLISNESLNHTHQKSQTQRVK